MSRTANVRWRIPADRPPPNRPARRTAHAASLNNSGIPVNASPRKLNIRTPCRSRLYLSKRWYAVGSTGAARVSSMGLLLRTPAGVGASGLHLHVGLHRTRGPEGGVDPEERENADEQRLHELRRVEQHRVARVAVPIGVRVVLREARTRPGVTLATRLDDARRRHGRPSIALRVDVVGPVAVGARGHPHEAQLRLLAVERVAKGTLRLRMTCAALAQHVGLPRRSLGALDLVRRVARHADRRVRAPLGQRVAVHAVLVAALDPLVALAAGPRHGGPE